MIRLYRILPLIIVIAILALAMYVIMSFRYSSSKAKTVMIKVFFWLFTVLSGIFLIVTLYALFDQNVAVAELFGSCLAVTLIGLIITLICRAIFKKNHPHFGEKIAEATFINESPLDKFSKAFAEALKQALKDTFNPKRK